MDIGAGGRRRRQMLEWLGDRAVPGMHRHRIGDWILRADRGSTNRANSVWPMGTPDGSVPEAVDEAEHWYRLQGRNARFQLYDGTDPELVDELDRRGYTAFRTTLMLTGVYDELVPALAGIPRPSSDGGCEVTMDAQPNAAFAWLMDDDDRLAEATTTSLPQRFVTINDRDGAVLGGGAVVIDSGHGGCFAMKTIPDSRRRGVASRVLYELVEAAGALGATGAWLQVDEANSGARSLYERFGFTVAHGYRYRVAQ